MIRYLQRPKVNYLPVALCLRVGRRNTRQDGDRLRAEGERPELIFYKISCDLPRQFLLTKLRILPVKIFIILYQVSI